MDIEPPSSVLSPGVRKLICDIGCHVSDEKNAQVQNDACFTADGSLKIDEVASLLPVPDNTQVYFENAARELAPVFFKCKELLASMSSDHIESSLLPNLQWTNSHEVLLDCLEMLRKPEENGAENILALLLVSSVLERALGNVYMMKGNQCPSMLKDLLQTSELADILGSSVMRILHVVIGPPISLNLRNVCWHGFLGDSELSSRYCCFLLLLSSSIGSLLSSKGVADIPQRQLFVWSPSVKRKLLLPSSQLESVEMKDSLLCLQKLLEHSKVIRAQTNKQWQLVFQLYQENKYGYCLSLLLPLLECSLRSVFATVNGCPQRMLTAESTTLYTTFTEMLEQNLPEGAPNELPPFLSTPCMDLLQDLLFYPEGPRVRDHLSHGEVDLKDVDQPMVYTVLCVCAYLATKLCPNASAENPFVKEMIENVASYRSQFHPIAILQEKYAELIVSVEKMDQHIILSPDLQKVDEVQVPFLEQLCENNPLFSKVNAEVASLWTCVQWEVNCPLSQENLLHSPRMKLDSLQKISAIHIPTLFQWQSETAGATDSANVMKESEYVGLLLRIVEEAGTAVKQVETTLEFRQQQLLNKDLRSRQRENLKKLLKCVPCLQVLLGAVTAHVGWHIQLLHDYSSLPPDRRKLMQRHLKTVLQHCENLRTLTSSDHNKWTESVDLLLSLLTKLQHFLTKWK